MRLAGTTEVPAWGLPGQSGKAGRLSCEGVLACSPSGTIAMRRASPITLPLHSPPQFLPPAVYALTRVTPLWGVAAFGKAQRSEAQQSAAKRRGGAGRGLRSGRGTETEAEPAHGQKMKSVHPPMALLRQDRY